MATNANAKLTKLAISILGVAALAGIAGRLSTTANAAPPTMGDGAEAALVPTAEGTQQLWFQGDYEDDDDEWEEEDEDEWEEHSNRARYFTAPPTGTERSGYSGRARSGRS